MKAKHLFASISIVFFVFIFSSLPVFAQQEEPPDKSYLLVPTEGAAGVNLSTSGNLGSLVFPIQLEVPPSRGGTAPTVELVYNSGNQKHGSWVGSGWSLDIGHIEISVKDSIPAYTLSDTFVLKLGNVSGELIRVSSSPAPGILEYRLERENQFLRVFFFPATSSWQAIDKEGVIYNFGSSDSSRLAGSAPTRVFRWALDTIENRRFNHVTSISYFKPSPEQLYPDTIDYFHGKVQFVLGDHPQPFTSRRIGFPTRVDKLLTEVKAFFRTPTGGFELVSNYRLEYTNQFCAVDLNGNPPCITGNSQEDVRCQFFSRSSELVGAGSAAARDGSA